MSEEELTDGEIRRTLERLERERADADDRITQVAGQMVPTTLFTQGLEAVRQSILDLKTETRLGFERVERTSLERRDALMAKDRDLGRQIGELKTKIDGTEKGRTAKAANWIAAGLLALTAIGLIIAILGQGGR